MVHCLNLEVVLDRCLANTEHQFVAEPQELGEGVRSERKREFTREVCLDAGSEFFDQGVREFTQAAFQHRQIRLHERLHERAAVGAVLRRVDMERGAYPSERDLGDDVLDSRGERFRVARHLHDVRVLEQGPEAIESVTVGNRALLAEFLVDGVRAVKRLGRKWVECQCRCPCVGALARSSFVLLFHDKNRLSSCYGFLKSSRK